MNPKFIDVMVLQNIFQELFQIWNIFYFYATKTRTKIAYEPKANGNLNEQTKFSNVQNHKKSYSTTTFRIILPLSPTEINRTPRSLL